MLTYCGEPNKFENYELSARVWKEKEDEEKVKLLLTVSLGWQGRFGASDGTDIGCSKHSNLSELNKKSPKSCACVCGMERKLKFRMLPMDESNSN